ncbi:MAG: hypothetical protein ACW97P_09330 [Candidatus Hodarchaeales archaeon]
MNMSNHKKSNLAIHSIQDYLKLFHKAWMVEFDVRDFGASVSTLYELPLQIYASQAQDFFLVFINIFLNNASISFIQKKGSIIEPNKINIDLAIVGYWNNEQYAIPLWILEETLFGFEIISGDNYEIRDSFQLEWTSFNSHLSCQHWVSDEEIQFSTLSNSLFNKNAIYFEINKSKISIANHQYSSELAFFEKIANTMIPEID